MSRVFDTEEEKAAYKAGIKQGRLEGALIYQKKLIENLHRDNEALCLRIKQNENKFNQK